MAPLTSSSSTSPPFSIRGKVPKRFHLSNRHTSRPTQAVASSSAGKQSSVSESSDDDVAAMDQVCVEEKVGPTMWPVCVEVDDPEGRVDNMIVDSPCVRPAEINELNHGIEEMDLDEIPTSPENEIVGFGYRPMEGVEKSFVDVTSRQFADEITMQIQLSMEMQVQEGGMIAQAVIKLIQLRRTYRDYRDNLQCGGIVVRTVAKTKNPVLLANGNVIQG
ncbi:hypothetical protein FPQ18DRAFT_303524 [Pyronema domesticum]|nr:hypothetical protein FPQ18DRAFT_303524 [Pyronema domesticum]